MTEEADAGAAWENPLIPNARLRQIYLAMMRARTLARMLPRRDKTTLGLEACLVSPAVDLGPGDLVSDVLADGVVDFLRGVTLGEAVRPGSAAKKRGLRADCGAAGRIANPAMVVDRIWAALGAAAALKALAASAKSAAVDADSEAQQQGVVVVYAPPHEVPGSLWRKALTFAREKALPVLFVVLPTQAKASTKTVGVSAIALRCGVPGMRVDKDDAVAIYRVAQESIGHARIGGGAALIECVPFVLAGTGRRRGPAGDGIKGLEQYILRRGVARRAWMDREAGLFAKRIADEKNASKQDVARVRM
jgi:TPP-dependent pyruvate/acetoin dehydrogenase alpha subunit